MIAATGGLPCMRRGPRRPRYALCTAWVPASPAPQVESAVWADRIGRCQQTAAAARQRKSPEPCRRLVCPGTNPGLSRSRSSASAKSATEKPAGTARRGARHAARTQDLTTPRRRLYECRSEAVARRRSRSGTIPIVSKRCEPSTATTAKQVYWPPVPSDLLVARTREDRALSIDRRSTPSVAGHFDGSGLVSRMRAFGLRLTVPPASTTACRCPGGARRTPVR
jgi:hypothetical protein